MKMSQSPASPPPPYSTSDAKFTPAKCLDGKTQTQIRMFANHFHFKIYILTGTIIKENCEI